MIRPGRCCGSQPTPLRLLSASNGSSSGFCKCRCPGACSGNGCSDCGLEMNSLQGLMYGLSVAATPGNLLAAFVGAFAGTASGVLPRRGPVAGVALILPLTFSLDPTAGLIMMAGIFYGSMYGGATPAILLNIPGESASVVTAIDGYQLAKKGRAGATLTIVAVGSFVGGTLAGIGVMLFSSLLANVAILFGPAEFFALTAGGLV